MGSKATVRLDRPRSVREALGVSQSEMSRLLGITLRALQSYEQEWRKTPPSVQRIAGLILYLRWRVKNPRQAPCWTITGCEPERRDACPAYRYRAGDLCWLLTGTRCRGKKAGTWEEKLDGCRRCPVMKSWLTA